NMVQAPSSKLQRNPKIQAPNPNKIPSPKFQTLDGARGPDLELGAWSFSGAWRLGFGASLSFGFRIFGRRSFGDHVFQIAPIFRPWHFGRERLQLLQRKEAQPKRCFLWTADFDALPFFNR